MGNLDNQKGSIIVDKDSYFILKDLHKKAVAEKKYSFIFQESEVSTSYVKHLLDFVKHNFERDEA
jgi:hypothetical protein